MDFLDIFLNKSDNDPLYYQLYSNIAQAVQKGELAAGEKLPGKRTAATQLGVSVNTVDEAYQMLAAEGYVQAQPRRGFVVCRLEQVVPLPHRKAQMPRPEPDVRQKWDYSFGTGDLDWELFPKKTWNRLFREVLSQRDDLFAQGDGRGEKELRQAISEYLRGYRGVQCSSGQIVVGAGLEVLFGMLARMMQGTTFALEDPGYPKAGHILENMGLPTLYIPVDGAGMDSSRLQQSGAGAVYLTPSHQFPTGGVMPAGRRTEILQWAAQSGGVILEDDYDSEFRFDGRPLRSLQGLDQTGHVVYAGTFSRSLAPGLRAAYLVLPPDMGKAWRQMYGDYACTVSRPEQHTLARLMQQGHFARSLNRVRNVYRARRDLLLQQLEQQLAGLDYQVENTHTGLYFVLQTGKLNAFTLAEQARSAGIKIHCLQEYARLADKAQQFNGLLLGYGGLQEVDIPRAVGALAKIWRQGL